MNEKFFDLKKEKQDRMINAAFEVFALEGYSHASTDEIVKKAGVSKGILFHYFISKLGLFTFLYDYSIRFLTLEIESSVDRNETDPFLLREAVLNAQVDAMHQYPYIQLFLQRCETEDNLEAVDAIKSQKAHLQITFDEIRERAIVPDLPMNGMMPVDAAFVDVADICELALAGLLRETVAEMSATSVGFRPEEYRKRALHLLHVLRGLTNAG